MGNAVKAPNDGPWQIWIDTGGTFTDCLARDPSGRPHRAKVLSTSALRGRVTEQLDPVRVRVHQNWGAVDDLIKGFSFRWMKHVNAVANVVRFDSARSTIELDRPLGSQLFGRNTAFEVKSADPAPVLAARLVTRTASGAVLPPIMMRLATTR